jgi:hypothetical protein
MQDELEALQRQFQANEDSNGRTSSTWWSCAGTWPRPWATRPSMPFSAAGTPTCITPCASPWTRPLWRDVRADHRAARCPRADAALLGHRRAVLQYGQPCPFHRHAPRRSGCA